MKTTGGYQLGITCCSCGGKLNVDEASHTISCPHCSSVLKIVRSSGIRKYVIVGGLAEHEVRFHIDRHMKKEGLPLPSRWRELQRIYVPFWRVIGTVFSLTTAPPEFRDQSYGTGAITTGESVDPGVTINTRDVSFCADEKSDLGMESLGVRTQIL